MSIYRPFSKTVGTFRVEISEPSPRWAKIVNTAYGDAIVNLSIEDLRDLQYAIGRILEFAADDDKQAERR